MLILQKSPQGDVRFHTPFPFLCLSWCAFPKRKINHLETKEKVTGRNIQWNWADVLPQHSYLMLKFWCPCIPLITKTLSITLVYSAIFLVKIERFIILWVRDFIFYCTECLNLVLQDPAIKDTCLHLFNQSPWLVIQLPFLFCIPLYQVWNIQSLECWAVNPACLSTKFCSTK